jgi:hypothetical protein
VSTTPSQNINTYLDRVRPNYSSRGILIYYSFQCDAHALLGRSVAAAAALAAAVVVVMNMAMILARYRNLKLGALLKTQMRVEHS